MFHETSPSHPSATLTLADQLQKTEIDGGAVAVVLVTDTHTKSDG
jgi:hypothetical protein